MVLAALGYMIASVVVVFLVGGWLRRPPSRLQGFSWGRGR